MKTTELTAALDAITTAPSSSPGTDDDRRNKMALWATKHVDMRAHELKMTRELARSRERETFLQSVIDAHEVPFFPPSPRILDSLSCLFIP